jgi:hypothetical protein
MCVHEQTRVIHTWCFSGPVAEPGHENPAAHGNVTYEEECVRCGARRLRNVNGWHSEYGLWGPSRSERRARAAQLRRLADALISAIPPIVSDRGGHARVDPEGYVVGVWDRLPAGWLAAAKMAREAVLAAERAEADV